MIVKVEAHAPLSCDTVKCQCWPARVLYSEARGWRRRSIGGAGERAGGGMWFLSYRRGWRRKGIQRLKWGRVWWGVVARMSLSCGLSLSRIRACRLLYSFWPFRSHLHNKV